jgi:hypothetical protein
MASKRIQKELQVRSCTPRARGGGAAAAAAGTFAGPCLGRALWCFVVFRATPGHGS